MRIHCPHCGSKATITSRAEQSAQVADLYCACRNTAHCGATFVFTLAYRHTLNPPIRTTADLMMTVLNALPPEERVRLGTLFS